MRDTSAVSTLRFDASISTTSSRFCSSALPSLGDTRTDDELSRRRTKDSRGTGATACSGEARWGRRRPRCFSVRHATRLRLRHTVPPARTKETRHSRRAQVDRGTYSVELRLIMCASSPQFSREGCSAGITWTRSLTLRLAG